MQLANAAEDTLLYNNNGLYAGSFGDRLGGLGDLDGDGADDLVLGAGDAGTSRIGRVYLFWGGW